VNSLLQPLAAGFQMGVALRHAAYRRGWFKTRRLARPVISVGNLSVGGTGKTPLVALIATTLMKLGGRPGILTRGYGRGGKDLVALLPQPNRVADPREVGDEPALLASALPEVPIVVCADRYRAGRLAEEKLNVTVHILDDGFQHLALARDLDIVVLDVTQEIENGALLPAGRLREPVSALQRANAVVISRTELGDPEPLAARVTETNPQAKIFRSTTKLCGFREICSETQKNCSDHVILSEAKDLAVRTAEQNEMLRFAQHDNERVFQHPEGCETASRDDWRSKPVLAFCGLGNPRAFFADLRRWGLTLACEEVFPDHHVYTEAELNGLAKKARQAGAAALITTEKDAMNFPAGGRPDLPVVACAVRVEVAECAEFELMLRSQLKNDS